MTRYETLFPGIENIDALLAHAFHVADLTTPERRGLFLANVAHESKFLTKLEEDLTHYTPERLAVVWPRKFADSLKRPTQLAYKLAGRPVELAEEVYGGRYGNTRPGDGYKYRGRGAIMLTFFANYNDVDQQLRLNGLLVANPDLVATPEYALLTGAAWWNSKSMNWYANFLAKADNKPRKNSLLGGARERVNAAKLGLKEVKKLYEIFCF